MDNGEVTSTCPETSESFQFPEDNFTDVSLLVEGQQLFTNRSLLAFASPVFSCMFTAEFKEKSEKVDVNVQSNSWFLLLFVFLNRVYSSK